MKWLNKLTAKIKYRKFGSDGYLLPQHWKCIACLAKNKATYAVRSTIFLSVIGNEQAYKELNRLDRSTIKDYVSGRARGTATKYLEDTTGLARDRSGMGFDAVYLCEAHLSEFNQAISTTAKK